MTALKSLFRAVFSLLDFTVEVALSLGVGVEVVWDDVIGLVLGVLR
jgi:hypothetical protein